MSAAPDSPKVIIFPPVIGIATVVLGLLLQWLAPLGALARMSEFPRFATGAVFLVAGAILLGGAARAMKHVGTNINPSLPTTALSADGVFKLSRNPMYVGGSLIMVALALFFALDWLLILFIPSQLVLFFGVIKPEEIYLDGKFGDQYRNYKRAVARYLFVF